jgi:uncharacterized membrane protein YccC
MPGSHLKRAEKAIEAIRNQSELPPEAADALQELVDAVRHLEGRIAVLEDKRRQPPNPIALPNPSVSSVIER